MVLERAESSANDSRSRDRNESSEPQYKFRNYVPQTNFLKGICVTKPTEPTSINHLIQDKLDLIPKDGNYKIDHKLLEPKKIDYDLKRRFEKRLKKLERDTSKSISEHVKKDRRKA
jgi:hypothetical protein